MVEWKSWSTIDVNGNGMNDDLLLSSDDQVVRVEVTYKARSPDGSTGPEYDAESYEDGYYDGPFANPSAAQEVDGTWRIIATGVVDRVPANVFFLGARDDVCAGTFLGNIPIAGIG